jgi:hypothetical protein
MPIPAIIGGAAALGNLGADLYSSYKDRQSRSEGRDWARGERAQAEADYDSILKGIDKYYTERGSLGTKDDVNAYRAAIAGYDPASFVYNRGQFGDTYNKTRDDFINPYYDQIIADTAGAVQQTAAGAGLGRGSGAAMNIADAIVKKTEELYKDAQAMYESDRDFEYRKYNDYATAMQDALNQRRAATDTKLAMQGNLANDYYSVMDARQADILRAQQDKMNTLATYNNAIAGLY